MSMVRPRNAFAVICHGDLWLSNILFRYVREENTTTTAAAGSTEAEKQQQQESGIWKQGRSSD